MNKQQLLKAIQLFKDKFDYLDVVSSNQDETIYKRRTTAKSLFFGCLFNHALTESLVTIASKAMNDLDTLSEQIDMEERQDSQSMKLYMDRFGDIITQLANKSMEKRHAYGSSYSLTEGPGYEIHGNFRYRQYTGWSSTKNYRNPIVPGQLEKSLLTATKALQKNLSDKANEYSSENTDEQTLFAGTVKNASAILNELIGKIAKVIRFISRTENYEEYVTAELNQTRTPRIVNS